MNSVANSHAQRAEIWAFYLEKMWTFGEELTRQAFVVDVGGRGAHDVARQAQKAAIIRTDECVRPARVQRRDCGASPTAFVPGGWCWLPSLPGWARNLEVCGSVEEAGLTNDRGREELRLKEDGPGMKEGGILCNSGKYQRETGACLCCFCPPPLSLLIPISHFCSVPSVPPSGSAEQSCCFGFCYLWQV